MARDAAQKVQRPAPARSEPAAANHGGIANTFEVQIFRDKRWRIDSMFDDKALALFEARRMNDSGRYVCVRVVEEHFDEKSGNTKLTTIYRGGRIEQAHQKDIEDAIKMRREIKLQEGVTEQEAQEAQAVRDAKSKKGRRFLWIGIGAGVVLVLGGVAFILLK